MAGTTQSPVAVFGWPPLLTTKLAAAYTGKSRWGIYRAIEAGDITPVGRRGRELVFAREDLDRYMLGPVAGGSTPAPGSSARSTSKTATADALARLKLLRGGAR